MAILHIRSAATATRSECGVPEPFDFNVFPLPPRELCPSCVGIVMERWSQTTVAGLHERLQQVEAERDDWRAAHHERFTELQDVCRDRDALVNEIVALRAELAQERNERDATADMLREARAENQRLHDSSRTLTQKLEFAQDEIERLQAALNVEHEVQRQMIERLGIEWPPGEPFYSLIESRMERLQTRLTESESENDQWQRKVAELWEEAKRVIHSN